MAIRTGVYPQPMGAPAGKAVYAAPVVRDPAGYRSVGSAQAFRPAVPLQTQGVFATATSTGAAAGCGTYSGAFPTATSSGSFPAATSSGAAASGWTHNGGSCISGGSIRITPGSLNGAINGVAQPVSTSRAPQGSVTYRGPAHVPAHGSTSYGGSLKLKPGVCAGAVAPANVDAYATGSITTAPGSYTVRHSVLSGGSVNCGFGGATVMNNGLVGSVSCGANCNGTGATAAFAPSTGCSGGSVILPSVSGLSESVATVFPTRTLGASKLKQEERCIPESVGWNSSTTLAPEEAENCEIRFPVGTAVEYHSTTLGGWKPAVVEGFNMEWGTYTLDIQPAARPGKVRMATPSGTAAVASQETGSTGTANRVSIDTMPSPRGPRITTAPASTGSGVAFGGASATSASVGATTGAPLRTPVVPSMSARAAQETLTSVPLAASPQAAVPLRTVGTSAAPGAPAVSSTQAAVAETYVADPNIIAAGELNETVDAAESDLDTDANADACAGPADPAGSAEEDPEVKVSRATLRGGETMIIVSDREGKEIGTFNNNAVQFELECDADSLAKWLSGLSTQLLPGLLTLITAEVTERGEKLKELEKQRDDARGTADYDFFGLEGDCCTDKDIDRAYRRASAKLHPDKGGDETQFNEMRKRYDQLKKLRGEDKPKKTGGGSINWDHRDRASMLQAHGDLREQLVWITRMIGDTEKELAEMMRLRTDRFLEN
eukprot:TRINITY_DN21861_c0_g1_i2.p1 TRINITY_DN21861_c0_g1~~TRINITY_DN21861_c0_g1_i2.p1  ORF type:complete len:744 (+),score=111.95 TRINITY_DN21861_c0_g1_i2:75-2234(+)